MGKSHGQPQMNNYQLTTYFSNIFNALYANMGNFNPLLIHVRIFLENKKKFTPISFETSTSRSSIRNYIHWGTGPSDIPCKRTTGRDWYCHLLIENCSSTVAHLICPHRRFLHWTFTVSDNTSHTSRIEF